MLHDGHHQQRQSHGHDSDEAQDFQQERALVLSLTSAAPTTYFGSFQPWLGPRFAEAGLGSETLGLY